MVIYALGEDDLDCQCPCGVEEEAGGKEAGDPAAAGFSPWRHRGAYRTRGQAASVTDSTCWNLSQDVDVSSGKGYETPEGAPSSAPTQPRCILLG